MAVDNEYLNKLMERFKSYKSPTETHQLIIALGEKINRTKEEEKNLNILLNAEKKLEQLNKARAEARKLLQAEKVKERKARNHRLIIWGSALLKASENDAQIAQIMQKLFESGYISERDKEVAKQDLKSNHQQIQSIHQLANFNRNNT